MADGEQRRRIEFRAGLAVVAAGSLMVTSPLMLITAGGVGAEDVRLATWAVWLFAAVGALGLTGWWLDAVRSCWGPHEWANNRRSTVNWLIPGVNLVAPPIEAGLLFRSAGRPAHWSRWWTGTWLVALLVTVLQPLEPRLWGVLDVSLVAYWTPAVLLLWLVISSMRSLRAEWMRRDSVELPPNASTVD